jgi:hypothetical protein
METLGLCGWIHVAQDRVTTCLFLDVTAVNKMRSEFGRVH